MIGAWFPGSMGVRCRRTLRVAEERLGFPFRGVELCWVGGTALGGAWKEGRGFSIVRGMVRSSMRVFIGGPDVLHD